MQKSHLVKGHCVELRGQQHKSKKAVENDEGITKRILTTRVEGLQSGVNQRRKQTIYFKKLSEFSALVCSLCDIVRPPPYYACSEGTVLIIYPPHHLL